MAMSKVKRWDIDQYEGEWATMREDTRGDYVLASDYDQLNAENERLGYEVEHLGVVGLQQVSAMLKAQQERDTLRKQLDEARELLDLAMCKPYGRWDLLDKIDAWLEAINDANMG